MADKETINIVDLQIKEEDVVKALTELKTKIDEAKQSTKELEKQNKSLEDAGKKNSQAYKENAAQIEKNKAQVKGLSTEYRNNQTILVGLNKDQEKNVMSLDSLRAKGQALRKERNQTNIATKEGRARLKELNTEIDKNDKLIKENSDSYTKQKINIGNYASALDGLPGPIGASVNGMKALTKSALAFIATPLGALIAALVAGFKLFQAAIKNSQPLLDRLDAAGAAFSATFKVLIDRVSTFAEGVVSAFENPKQAIADLWNAIKSNILNRIEGIAQTFVGLGKVIKNTFKLNFEEAGEAAKDVGKSLVQAFTGVEYDTIKKSIKGITEEIKTEAKEASNLENQLRALEDAEIAFITQKASLNKVAREALTLSKDQTASDQDRIDNLQLYLDTQDKIYGREVELAKERARISQAQIDQGNSTREELRANAELQARAAELEAELAQRRGEAVSLLSGLQKTLFNENMARIQAEIAAKKQLYDAELAQKDALREIEEEDMANILEAMQVDSENRLEILNNSLFGEFEARRQWLEMQKQMEIEAAESLGADVNLVKKKYANLEIALETEKALAVADIASQTLGNISSLFGEATKAGKLAAAAQTTVETIKGAIMAFNSFASIPVVGTVLGGIAAAAVTATGVKAVRDIYATKSGLPGDSAGGGGNVPSIRVPSGATSATSAASINDGGTVSRSIGADSKNTMKDAFSEALQENPLQPTLVVDEVTAKQTEQTNISKTATV